MMQATPKPLQKTLAKFPQLEFAMLFGSLASGSANEQSDIDLAVMANAPLDAKAKISLIEALAKETGRAVDLIDSALATSLKKAVGFRNIEVHGYTALDFELVYNIASKQRVDFQNFARIISK